MENEIRIVIGSWGSYNECNARALGSKWLNLSEYSDWDEIEKKLKQEGFELDGIDEELFIQDIDGIVDNSTNWNYINPQKLFETLQKAGILIDDKYEIMTAFIEVRSLAEFMDLVDEYGKDWDGDIEIYKNMNFSDVAYRILHETHEIPEYLENYIDYDKYGKDLEIDGSYERYSGGIIKIY